MSHKTLQRCGLYISLFLLMVWGAWAQSIADLTLQANAAQSQGRYDDAINSWNALLAKDAKNRAAYRSRGACYFHKNDFENAIADFSQAIALNTNDAAAYSGRGDSRFKKGDLDDAISDFNRAIRLSPKAIVFYQHIIDVYWDKQDWDNVITNATKVIQLSAGNEAQAQSERAWASDMRGLARRFKGDLDNALEDFNAAIQLSPTWDEPLANRAQVRQKQGDLQGALVDLDEAVRLNPTNEQNYDLRGTIYKAKKDWDADIKNWNEAIQNNPTNANFLQGRAWAYQHGKKDFDRAIVDYDKAIELNAGDPGGYIARGYAYQRQNLPDKAIADFTKLVEMQPTNSSAYFRRASVYFEARKYKEARSDYEQVIRLDPKSSFGYLELAWCLATCPDSTFRNGKEALELAQKGFSLEKGPNVETGLECAVALAVAYAETGDFEQAVQNQKQAISYYKQLTDGPGVGPSAKTEAMFKERLQLFEQHKPYHGVVKMSDLFD